jgi:hypothetical protein
MVSTSYPELNIVLQELVAGVSEALGSNFVAACLQGSFAVGDFDRHSDVDFIIATARELEGSQVRTLQDLHGRIHDLDCDWAQHLEGSYFPTDILRDCAKRGRPLWYLDHGSRSLVRSDHCNTAVVRWVVRERGVSLAGPAPKTLVDPISVETLRGEITQTIGKWGREILNEPERFSNRFYLGYIVLSYCRMLHDLDTGFPGSKRAGADWAKATLDPAWGDLIDRAWRGRPNPALSVQEPADPADFERTLEFVRYAIALTRTNN